jgi:D-beta-D-heptose 7-phosphate kinase/D-beta-D-heptose 1-phosphate adenosyltransferase
MKPNILVCGDVMLDKYLWGETNRVSPEAPVPVIEVSRTTHALGGAANVANNVTHLGGQCELFGVIGDDAEGHLVLQELRSNSITSRVMTDPARVTTCKTRLIARGQQIARIDIERRDDISDHTADLLFEAFQSAAACAQICVISDYNKGVISSLFAALIIQHCRRIGVPVIVDPKGSNCDRYRGATLIKPNRDEASQFVRRPLTGREEIISAGSELLKSFGGDGVLITLGAEGMALFRTGCQPEFFTTEVHKVFDVTGAGDTALAALAVSLSHGREITESVRYANAAASLAVAKVGTSVITEAELASIPVLSIPAHV